MFRKIHSKERETTILQELKNEFSPHVVVSDIRVKDFMDRHAKIIFCAMILIMVGSFILAFFILKPEESTQAKTFEKELNAIPQGLGGEFSALQNLSSRAVKISDLKAKVEQIISQEFISEEDSAYLEKAIEQLQYFHKHSEENEIGHDSESRTEK